MGIGYRWGIEYMGEEDTGEIGYSEDMIQVGKDTGWVGYRVDRIRWDTIQQG